jgi:hypothetical protein
MVKTINWFREAIQAGATKEKLLQATGLTLDEIQEIVQMPFDTFFEREKASAEVENLVTLRQMFLSGNTAIAVKYLEMLLGQIETDPIKTEPIHRSEYIVITKKEQNGTKRKRT